MLTQIDEQLAEKYGSYLDTLIQPLLATTCRNVS